MEIVEWPCTFDVVTAALLAMITGLGKSWLRYSWLRYSCALQFRASENEALERIRKNTWSIDYMY